MFGHIGVIEIAESLHIIQPEQFKNIGYSDTCFHIRAIVQCVSGWSAIRVSIKLVKLGMKLWVILSSNPAPQ